MEFIIYAIVSYLIYSAFLIWQDFQTHFTNAPMYVKNPRIGRVFFTWLVKPLFNIYPISAKNIFFSLLKLLIKIGILSFILHLIITLF